MEDWLVQEGDTTLSKSWDVNSQNHNSLPYDVMVAIVGQVGYKDLKSLSLVSRGFSQCARERLFRSITFAADEDKFCLPIGISNVVRRELTQKRPAEVFPYIKYVRLIAPFHRNIASRCPIHHQRGRLSQFMDILVRLPPHSLRGFSYDIGSCLPEQLFLPPPVTQADQSQGDRYAYLVENQKNLEFLSLITDPECLPPHDGVHWDRRTIALATFERLRELSWRGLWRPRDVKAVRKFLAARSDVVEVLLLDFIDWRTPKAWRRRRSAIPAGMIDFATYVLSKQPSGCIIPLVTLQKLSLFGVYLQVTKELLVALNFMHLKALSLRECQNVPELLRLATSELAELSLLNLELITPDGIQEDEETALTQFLKFFEGLEHLRLLIAPTAPSRAYWSSMASHKATLRTLVYHQRGIEPQIRHTRGLFNVARPRSRLYNLPPEGDDASHVHAESWATMKIQYLGICAMAEHVRTILQHSTARHTIKLLHIRGDGDCYGPGRSVVALLWLEAHAEIYRRWRDLGFDNENLFPVYELGRWAFGPDGLPNLQVLAWGDFSYRGRFENELGLLGRLSNSNPDDFCNFEVIRPPLDALNHGHQHFDGLHQPLDFLSACPSESLFMAN